MLCHIESCHVLLCQFLLCCVVLRYVTLRYVTLCYVMEFICLEREHHLAYLHYAANASSTNTVLSALPTLHPTCLLLESAEAHTYDITDNY